MPLYRRCGSMKKWSYVVMMACCFAVMAQDKVAMKYGKSIAVEDLRGHLQVLTSDEYEGRETGKKGQKMAAKYIASHFESIGLQPPVDGSYYQSFDLTESALSQVYFRNGEEKKLGSEDFIYYSSAETFGEEYIKITFVADGDVLEGVEGTYAAFSADGLDGFQDKVQAAKEAGAIGFLLFLKDSNVFGATLARFGPFAAKPRLSLDARDNDNEKMIIGDEKLAEWLFEKPLEQLEKGETVTRVFNADYLDKPISTENVLGYLQGSEKPEELLVFTAHYDHVGIIDGEIHNGADDDGSGTVSLLEIAEAFSKAAKKNKRPRRSVLFMALTGEEKGLLGSKYYTDTAPVFPLENTVTNLNIDMVGRVDHAHQGQPDYVYVIGSDKLSTELHELSEKVNETYTKLDLDYTYNDENDPNRFYYRSDHYNFAKNNIPIIFYFNGTHPDYHKPTDTIEKIALGTLQKRAQLVFYTGWELANREERVKVDK